MNLDVLKTHSAFQQQLGASAGGCARNRPAAEERADAAVGERQEPQGFGMPRALRDLIPREANVVPSPGRWANPAGSNHPLSLPFPPTGVYGGPARPVMACAGGTGGQDGGPWFLWPPPGAALPIPSSSGPSAGHGADALVCPGSRRGHAAAGWKFRLRV